LIERKGTRNSGRIVVKDNGDRILKENMIWPYDRDRERKCTKLQ